MHRPFLLLLTLLLQPLRAADWPQWMGPARDGVWDEPRVTEADPAKATLQWQHPIGGGYAGPAVAGGKVFTLSFHKAKAQPDTSQGIQGEEELLCLSATDGRELWKHRWAAAYTIDYPDGPRATPTVHGDRVYVLGAEGRLLSLETATGKPHWQHDLKTLLRAKSPLWGFAGHPLIWQDLLICLGAGDSGTAVAFDRLTGEEKWRALSSRQGSYCPPTLIHHSGKDQIILWHGESINALDPRTGTVAWTLPRETKFGVSMAGPVHHDGQLLVSNFWWGSKMLQLPTTTTSGEPRVLWETERESDTRTEHLNALMCTPLLVDSHLYGVCSYGQLRCLEWKTGKRLWETFAPTSGKEQRWGNAFITRLSRSGSHYLLASEQGHLIRASLTPAGYQEISRKPLIEPNSPDIKERPVVWSHPAYSNGCIFLRNSTSLKCWRLIE